MFASVLIANRGEIACRIIRTCQRLGIRTVAVYSEADASALHVAAADEAYLIGPPPVGQSYLLADAILDVAVKAGVEAIHPGYGLLSERADFARACAERGIVFIGPSAEAMESVGRKLPARAVAARVGFPVIPGSPEPVAIDTVEAEAARVGFPLLLKASAGGGGIGMTRVNDEAGLARALERARTTAERAFGDLDIYIERILEPARHVEVQVLADKFGHGVALGTRDCSVQRRHQKVIEESLAPNVTPAVRAGLAADALRLAQAIGYYNAGTVECLVSGSDYYFLEVNTRLQVEHAVTEEVFGLDLVEQQLRVAAGEVLADAVLSATPVGHAIECRIYAEDPVTYMPSPGVITSMDVPEASDVRLDTGFRAGDTVTPYYDPLIAKLVVKGADRASAVSRLSEVLAATQIEGLKTNLPMLRAVAKYGEFVDGMYDTGILDRFALQRAK